MTRDVVVLDRDGTIVVDRGYLDDPTELAFLPGAAEGLRLLSLRGYRLVVITNQSGVGRGFFSLNRLLQIHERLTEMVASSGGQLEGIYFCPHTPDANCSCRKPQTGLVDQAASELGFDPSTVVVVGDKESDVELGKRLGALTILISADLAETSTQLRVRPDFTVSTLYEAALIIARENEA